MASSEEYRRHARECVRLAQQIQNAKDKAWQWPRRGCACGEANRERQQRKARVILGRATSLKRLTRRFVPLIHGSI
jgi:hypothetical protein